MKLFTAFSLICAMFITSANAAAPQPRRGQNTVSQQASTASAPASTSARAARVNTRGGNTPAPGANTAPAQKPGVAARAATTQKAPVSSKARAATTQKVINSGTKVAGATKNTVVSEECQEKYDGCMDSFCMLDNMTGGRCICSNKITDLDYILAEIEKLDQQSYQMATAGVERLEMGEDAEQVIAKANAAAKSVTDESNGVTKRSTRKQLDLSAWDAVIDDDLDTQLTMSSSDDITNKKGDSLHQAAAELCRSRIPECSADISMLQMMYAQKIRSDCAAYENSLRQQKTASAQKLQTAEKALREAALDQLHSANKYDLGQCTIEFKKCMVTTAGCGDDFSNCASVSAMDSTSTQKSSKKSTKTYNIKGATTTIEISASTYDTLEGKKPLCMTVTKQCVNVRDQVWDTFLKEVAPQLKSAELIAEDNIRQNCIGNISQCFQKACKDNMDQNDPEGSYDMCLSRPETMLNVCKIPLNNCNIDTTSSANAQKSQIWDFIVARLASMRVDACTKQVKSCLTSTDRCGKDYTNCIGLDTDTIMNMCPYEKLTSCVEKYDTSNITKEEVNDKLAETVQGIMLNIDNNFLNQCQNAANQAMIKICGDTENCTGMTVDSNIGTRGLTIKVCPISEDNYDKCYDSVDSIPEAVLRNASPDLKSTTKKIFPHGILGMAKQRVLDKQNATLSAQSDTTNGEMFDVIIDGTINWGNIQIEDDVNKTKNIKYTANELYPTETNKKSKEIIDSDIATLQNNIKTLISTIEADPTVQFCKTGRKVQTIKRSGNNSEQTHFGDDSGDNSRFPNLTDQMSQIIASAALRAAQDNYAARYKKLLTEQAQQYVKLTERIATLKQQDALSARRSSAQTACLHMADGTVVGDDNFTAGNKEGDMNCDASSNANTDFSRSCKFADNSFKMSVVATFESETLKCHVCTTKQTCAKANRRFCKQWNEETTSCTDTQF